MSAKNLLKWLVNLSLLMIFLAAYFLDLTGINLHQWLGLAAAAIAVFHLLNHWQWVKAVTQRLYSIRQRRFPPELPAGCLPGLRAGLYHHQRAGHLHLVWDLWLCF